MRTEEELLDTSLERLRDLLPDLYQPTRVDEPGLDEPRPPGDGTRDDVWRLGEQGSSTEILVEAKQRFTPRDAERLLSWLRPSTRHALGRTPVLVVTAWLSPRSRELLAERNVNYLDLTGNVRIRLERPTLYLHLQGADRDPAPPARSPVRGQGKGIIRLIRTLVDFAPPYRLTDLARASGLSQGYVSRALDSLDEQAFIRRGRRGVVEEVDWPALLRARADGYNLIKYNQGRTFIAPEGASRLYARLTEDRPDSVTVTGSYAAREVAQIAAPAQLTLYAHDPQWLLDHANLLPADRGADVVILRPGDPSQTDRPRLVEGLRHVGLSQLALDCLGGNGRLPEEGDAVLEWMRENEHRWRLPRLPHE